MSTKNGFEVMDATGAPLRVGQRVRTGTEEGVVLEITEPDADYDDTLGRGVTIGPFVVVRYDNGDEERWTARSNVTGPWDDERMDYTCDDVEVV